MNMQTIVGAIATIAVTAFLMWRFHRLNLTAHDEGGDTRVTERKGS